MGVWESAKKPTAVECPQFTSTPCNRIGFPYTPVHAFSPIPGGNDNETNSHEGPINKKTPVRQIATSTALSPRAIEQSPFIVAENVEVEAEIVAAKVDSSSVKVRKHIVVLHIVLIFTRRLQARMRVSKATSPCA